MTQGSTHSRSLSPLLSRQLPGVGGRSFNSAPPAPHEYADKCVTSVPERLELYGEAHPKPPTLRRRAPKNIKNPSLCWGESFLDGIRVAQEHNPGPPIEGTEKLQLEWQVEAKVEHSVHHLSSFAGTFRHEMGVVFRD